MSDISFHSPRVRIDLDLLDKIETEHGGVDMSEQWYCLRCGFIDQCPKYDAIAGFPTIITCPKCDENVRKKPPQHVIAMQERIAALEAIIQYHPGGDCMSYTELAEEYGKLIKVAEEGIAIWEATPEEVDRYLKEQGV